MYKYIYIVAETRKQPRCAYNPLSWDFPRRSLKSHSLKNTFSREKHLTPPSPLLPLTFTPPPPDSRCRYRFRSARRNALSRTHPRLVYTYVSRSRGGLPRPLLAPGIPPHPAERGVNSRRHVSATRCTYTTYTRALVPYAFPSTRA